MRIDIVTIFPAMVENALRTGVVRRARIDRGDAGRAGRRDLREFTTDRHRVVDDVPYGGGRGWCSSRNRSSGRSTRSSRSGQSRRIVLTSPQGTPLTQDVGERLSRQPHLLVLCGRYEGVDERVRSRVDEEISIGDYVLSGGELRRAGHRRRRGRFIPGVVGDDQSVAADSFSRGLLIFRSTRGRRRSAAGSGPAAESAGGAAVGQPRRDSPLAEAGVADAHAGAAAGLLNDASLDEEEQEILRELVAAAAKVAQRRKRRSMTMGAMEVVEQSQLAERPAMKSGDTVRVHVKVAKATRSAFRSSKASSSACIAAARAPRSRAKGLVRTGRRAHLSAALADDSEDRSDAVGQGRRAKLYYLRDLKVKAARMKGHRQGLATGDRHGTRSSSTHAEKRATAASGFCYVAGVDEGGPGVSRRPGDGRRRRARPLSPHCLGERFQSGPGWPEREELFEQITRQALGWGGGLRRPPARSITFNIHQASLAAMRRAGAGPVAASGHRLVDGVPNSRVADGAARRAARRSSVRGELRRHRLWQR
jgi:tRNA (guanine37-N1)-methyltransferase